MSKSEIRDFIIWYMTSKTDETTLRDFKQLEKFIKEELDITEALIREDAIPKGYPNHYEIKLMTELFKNGRCVDLALLSAKKMTDQFHFLNREYQMERWGCEWETEHEEALINWLLCRCDTPPEVIPGRDDFHYFISHDYLEAFFAAMSCACDFPVRYCAYAMYRGTIYAFKFPFRSLISYREEGYADSVIDRIKKIYAEDFKLDVDKTDSDIMTEFAIIYCGRDKKKTETAFYKKYIDKWMEEDRERFLEFVRNNLNVDFRKKVLKKLTGSAK